MADGEREREVCGRHIPSLTLTYTTSPETICSFSVGQSEPFQFPESMFPYADEEAEEQSEQEASS